MTIINSGVDVSIPIGTLVEQKIRQLEFDTGTTLDETGTLRVLSVADVKKRAN